jgi:cation:H+ antiporter
MSILFLLLGFIALVAGGEFLVRASVGLSLKLNLSRMIIGLTVVSFATSAPELIVSVQSALNGLSGLAVGNVLGSNIANIGVVLGITALIAPLTMQRDFFKYSWPWMVFFSFICYGLLKFNNDLSRWEGLILLSLLSIFLIILIRRAHKEPTASSEDTDAVETGAAKNWSKILLYLFLGGAALWLGSVWLVDGAVDIAKRLNIPESVIAVSMIAIGTSVPELAASIIAALKKEKALSLGNLVGSNIFNIGSVLGITALIEPIYIDGNSMRLLNNDIWWMLGFAIILLPLALLPQRNVISRGKGAFLIGAYCLFIYLAFHTL